MAESKKNEEFETTQASRSWGNPRVPAVLYLLAYGNEGDWREVTNLQLSDYQANYLAYVVDDPLSLARRLAKRENHWELARMSAALRADPSSCDRLATEIENEVYSQAYLRSGESGTLGSIQAERPLHTYQVLTSFWRPQSFVANYFLDPGKTIQFFESTWLPWPATAEVAKQVRNTGLDYAFEYFSHEDYLKHTGSADSSKGKNADLANLQQAAHSISYRAFYTDVDSFHDGIERRPFLLVSRNPDQGNCATSGVLEVQPVLAERTLRLGLHFRQQDSVSGVGFFPAANLKSRTALKDGGKSLLDAIRLRRGDRTFTINGGGSDEHGGFVYEAAIDQADLTGIYLEVDLRFKDEPVKAQLVYDLFASDYARELRRKTGEKGTARAGDVQQGGL
jgi:hypothetical protein